MKRVRPSASIEEWVACTVALAVKLDTDTRQTRRIKQQALGISSLKEEIVQLGAVIRRYHTDYLHTLDDLALCSSCDYYWNKDDLFDCDGNCDLRCSNCVDIRDCAQCSEPRCDDDCLSYCSVKGCMTRICNQCIDKNSDCQHTVCEDHSGPCTLCPKEEKKEDEASSSSE